MEFSHNFVGNYLQEDTGQFRHSGVRVANVRRLKQENATRLFKR